MNLTFWKKKTGSGEHAESVHEPLDLTAAQHDVAERSPESSVQKADNAEAPAKTGLIARIKSRVRNLARHFKKPPAFRADANHAPDAPGSPEKTVDAATTKDAEKAPDMAAPVKPGLSVRIKLRFIALAQRFKKTPAAQTAEDHAAKAGESPAPEMPGKPGFFTRIKAGFAAFRREFKAPAAKEDHYADSHSYSEAAPETQHPDGEPDIEPAVHSSKHLFIGGAVGLLVFLLLSGAVVALWPLFDPPQKRWGTRHDITTIASRPQSEPGRPETEVEALKRENAELHAQIGALRKERQQQRPYAPPGPQAGGNLPSSAVSGEMTIGSDDPKVTAMSLKEAIEAMNASSGDYDKKPAQ